MRSCVCKFTGQSAVKDKSASEQDPSSAGSNLKVKSFNVVKRVWTLSRRSGSSKKLGIRVSYICRTRLGGAVAKTGIHDAKV